MNLTPDIIHSPTGNNVHDFGSSVAVDGQTVLVGCSQYTSVDGARVGRTFFYEYNSKNGEFSDFSDDGSTSGGTVTLSGSLGMSKALGKVSFNYFQKVNGRWELTQTYRENTSGYYFKTGCSPSGFGASNSMSDHYFIAGYNTAGGTYVSTYECQNGPGKAFIYKYNGSIWGEQTSFTGNDSINEDYFGNNVDMHKEYAVITAPGHASGAVYVFKRNNESWSQQQKIVADANITYFGAFAAIHNNYIVTSGVNEDGNLRDKTAYQPHIYIYKRDDTTWQLSQEFFIPTRYDSQYITGACDISDQYLAIFLHTKTFLYKRIGDNWKLADILDKGYSIAISDDLLVTGDNNTTASVYPLSSRPRISIETTEISVANPVRCSITTPKNTRITLEAVSKNESIVPSGGIDINKSGENVFQLNTTANEPAQFTLWITPGWTLFADVPIVLTATDLDGQSATTTLICYSPTAATEVKLNHPQGSAGFGRDIGVGNDFLVVASADKSLLYYEFDGESWIYKQKISSIGNGANESQIHVDGNDIVIGERYYNSYAGRVVILTKEGSSFQQSYINPPAELLNNPSLQFGSQLDINNGYLVVGVSKYMSSNYIYYGAVYVYKKDNSWNPVHTIVGEIDNKKLGQYVAISGDHIITVSDDYTYFFKRDGDSWNQVNQFPKDPDRNFKAVEINGNFAAVSMSPVNQELKPVLYMFQYKDNTWTPSQTITYHELNYRERNSSNGYSVSMSGNYMACSFLSDAGDLEKPYVFLYRRSEDQWILVSRIYSEKSFKLNKRDLYYNSDTFGNAIALSGTTLLVAEKDEACQNMVDENRCGAVYVYRDEQFAITYKKIDVLSHENIQLWLSAQDINNTNHGDPIALWEDHSSVNNDLIQSESTARPTFVSNAIHGFPSVKFDGISQFLKGPPISGQTIFAVLRLDADATPGATLMSDINNPEYDNIAIESPGTWATGGDSNFSKGTLFVNGAQTSAYESGKFHILSLQSAGQRDFEFELGKSQNNTFFKGDIAELIVYKDKLDTFARKQIESSLANTYGITIVDDIYAGDSLDKGQYIQNIAYIGKTSDVLNTAAGSRGLTLGNQSFLQDNGDYIMFGHNIDVNALTGENLPSEVKRRWSRSWYLDMDDVNANGGTVSFHFNYVVWGHNTPEITLYNKNLPPSIGYRWNRDWFIHFDDTNANGGDITIKFDFMGVGFGEPFDAEYFLIHRDQPNDTFEKIDATPVVTDRSVDFVCDVSDLTDGYYCIGMNLLLEIEDLTGTPAGLPVSETANQLSLWLKPEKLTRQSAGTPTQIWADASVHENNLTQEIKTSQPLYTPNVINGQPALYFDGTNDYMDTLNDALTARTVFAVLKIDEDAPYLSCLLTETDKDENNIRTNVPVSVWRATQHYADLNDFSYKGFAAVNGADTDLHDNQYHVLTQMSASQKDFHLRISQVLQSRYFKGYLSELVIFENPLNKAQRRIMENYLSAKYNISIVGDRYQGDDIHSGNYDLDVSGIGKDYDGHSTTGQSGGLIIQDIDFLKDEGDYLLYGHHTPFNIITTNHLDPNSGLTRWSREWFIDVTDTDNNSGQLKLTFDYSKAGFYTLPPAKVALLVRDKTTDAFDIIAVPYDINKDQIAFTVSSQDIADKYITVGLLPSDYMIDFTDTGAYIDAGNEVDIINTSFSVEFWAKRAYTDCAAFNSMVGHGSDLQDYSALSIGFHYCKFRFDFYNDELQTTSDYNDLDWHHWAVTYDSSTQERIIYRDGHEVARDTAGDYYTGSGAFTIGKCLRGSFNGQLDEVRLWNDVRSPEEIRENMHRSMDTTEQGLEAYYPLNEGQGNTPADLSPNAFSTQMMDAAGNEWQVSTAPLSSRFGSGKLALALKFNTPEIPVYIARMDNNPNGSLPPEAIESRYWVATCFDQCTFNADMTFTIPEYLRSGDMIDPERFSLYQRNGNGTGDWTRVSDACLVDELLNTVTFQDVSLTGQFMLARFNTPPVAVSGYRLNDFDGLDDYLQVDKPLILSHTDFTIEFWAKRSNISGLHDVISHQTFSGDTGINIGFSNDDMRFSIHDHTLSARIVNNEDWHHYACVFHHEKQRLTIFQDGVQLAASVAPTGYDESGNLLFGKSVNGNYFEGALDDIRFWTDALEQETIQKNRFKPINPFIHPELETYYRFDDLESDTIARDATVNHRDATLVNMTSGRVVSDVWKNRSINPSLSRMNAGNALDFNESFEGHYADLPDIFDSSPDAFTIEWWAYADSLSETKPMYIHAISDDNNFHCAATSQGAIQMGTYTGVTLPDNRFETGKWQHLAFTYDGYTGTVYINGILHVSEPMVAPSAWNGLRLGDTDHPFQVMIDELRIWNIARTETQIQNTMYSQPENITGLSAWYKFDEFSGNRARDYAGNHHAILYNMDTFHCFKPSHVWDTYNQSAQNELIIYSGYDTDMDDTVTIHMISQPEHGELEIHPFDQQMIYMPSENYVGDDAFTFQLSDGRKTTDCTIQIHMNHLPEIQENLSDLSLTAGSSGTQFNITLNDQETSAENLHITASSSMPELLDIQISGSGNTRTITLTPHENTTGKTEITLFVDDGAQRSQQSFNVTVSDAALTSADGLMIFNRTFKKDTGDTVSLSSNNQPVNIVVDQIPAGVTGRWEREWQLTLNDINTNGGNLAFTFDFGDAAYNGNIYDHYVLLKQNAPGQDYTVIATPETPKPSGDQITFVVNADILDNTATYTLGKSRGYLLNFDGISSAVDCGTSIMLDPMKDFTVEAWVRIEEGFGMLPIVSKGMPSDATKGYALYINSWRTEDRRIVFETQNNLLYTDANIIEWGKWYHIAVVVSDKDNGKMYLNGMPVPVNGAVNLSTHVDAPFQIGTIMNNGWFFHGQMDEVRLWSKALSASEIRDRMFMKINTNIPGLTACWGFNEGRGTSFFDSSGNNLTGLWLNDGPISRKPGVLAISGLYSQHRNTTFIVNALTFDGTGFVSSDFETPVNTFTIEAWVKSSDAPSDSKTSYIFDKGHNFRITWDHPNVAYRGAVLVQQNNTVFAESYGLLKRDTWYHMAATYDGNTIKTYKNGALIAENTTISGNPTDSEMAFTIGKNFEGIIADVRVWDTALTISQIQSHMNTTLQTSEDHLILYWLFNAGADDFVSDLSLNNRHGKLISMPDTVWTALTPNSYTPDNEFIFQETGVTMQFSSEKQASVNVTKMPGLPHNPPGQFEGVFLSQYWVISHFGTSDFSASITFTVLEDIIQQDLDTACSIKLLRRDETSGGLWEIAGCSSAVNQSKKQVLFDNVTQDGQYILGRTNGIPVAGSGKAILFNGNDTNVTIPKLFETPPPAWTIEWFMNPSDLSNAQTSYYLGAMEGFDAFAFYVSSDGSVFVGTEENNAIQTEADFIQKDTWQHIAFTFNRGVAKLYKNGTLIQSKEGMANSIPWNGFMGQYIMGQLDELRFWQCALSADTIRDQMYTPLTGNETDLVAYYQMDQAVAANLLDTKDVYHGDIENPDDVSYCLSTAWATRVVNTNGNVSVQTGYDFEGQLNATILVSPSHGHIDIDNPNTRLIYHVDQDYSGTDTFSYSISDGLETDSYTITMFTNSLPQLSGIPTETKIMEGVTAFPVAFQLTDTDTDISQLSLHVETSDSRIVDLSDIDIDGTGSHRFLRITTQSCQAGPVTLTLAIDDGYARIEYSVNLIIESGYHDGPGGICSKDQGLALWFKADAISGLLDGTPLQKWDDLSYHQNHVSQSNQKHRPIYRTNQINGLPAVSFDGLDDALIVPFSSTPPVNALSLFSVNRTGTDKIKDESQIIISLGEHLRKGFRMGRLDSESTYQPVLISYHNTIDRLLKHSQSLSDIEFTTMSGIWYSDRIDFGCNEQTETEQYSDAHGPFLYGENLYLTLGADRRRDGFSTSFLKGDIAEIFAYDTGLSSAHVHILQTYMNVKYGLSDSRNELGMQTHTTDVCGIGREGDGANKVFYSQGLIVRDYGFLSDDGDYLFAAHNGTPIIETPENTPDYIFSRWSREWVIKVIDTAENNGMVELAFDLSAANIPTTPIQAVLLRRNTDTEDFTEVTVTNARFSNNEIRFMIDVSDLTGASYYTLGMNPGYAVSLNGDGMIRCAHIERPYSMTISAWINLTQTQNGEIISWADSNDNSLASLYIDNGTLAYQEDNHVLTGNSPLTANEWQHIAITKNGSLIKLYVNGTLDTQSNTIHAQVQSSRLIIGNQLQASLDHLVIWQKVLNPSEIQENMHLMQVTTQDNIYAYWPFRSSSVDELISGLTSTTQHVSFKVSDAPVSTGVAQSFTETSGIIQQDTCGVRLNYHLENQARVVISKLDRAPSVVPQTSAKILAGQYWIVERYGSGDLDMDITFTLSENLVEEDLYVKLFRRNANGQWELIAASDSIDPLFNRASFLHLNQTGQFILVRGNTSPIISPIADQISLEDAWHHIPFEVSDMETPLSLTIEITSPQKIIDQGTYTVRQHNDSYTLSILPSENMYGAGNITLIATDPEGLSHSVHFIQVVQPANDAPDAYSGTMTFMNGDTLSTYTLTSNDIDGDSVQYIIIDDTAVGGNLTLTQRSSGFCTYTPYDGNEEREFYFDFKAFDGKLDSSPGRILVKINPPVADLGTIIIDEDMIASGTLTGTIGPDGIQGQRFFRISTQAKKGEVILKDPMTGSFIYKPNPDVFGYDSFEFVLNDTIMDSVPAQISITIHPIDDPPFASENSFTFLEDTPSTGIISASDADNDMLTVLILQQPQKGTITLTNINTGAFTFIPNANETGDDAFFYRVYDHRYSSDPSVANIYVTPVNDPPVAYNGNVQLLEDTPISYTFTAFDLESSALDFMIDIEPTKGTITLSEDVPNQFHYTPNEGASGDDSFMFRASDGELRSNLAMMSIHITAVNDAPVAYSDSLTLDEDTAISYSLNAFDSDGDWVSRRIDTLPEKGIVQLIDSTTGEIIYIPDPDAFGDDHFTYVVFDGNVLSEPATISVVINPINDAPQANTDTISIFEDIFLQYTLTGFDPDDDTLTFSLVNTPSKGTIHLADATKGVIHYTPDENVFGDDQIIFKVNDGILNSDPAVLTIRIKEFNDPPVAMPFSITLTEDMPISFTANGTDPDNDPITYRMEMLPLKGILTLLDTSTGRFQYTPNENIFGTDSFSFVINDSFVDSEAITVTINITPVNDPPIGKNYVSSIVEDTPAQFSLIATDVENNDLSLSLRLIKKPSPNILI